MLSKGSKAVTDKNAPFILQRSQQLHADQDRLRAKSERIEHRIAEIRHEYLDLAHRQGIEGLAPVGIAVIPRRDRTQTLTARRYTIEGWTTRALGALVTGWVSLGAFNAELGFLGFAAVTGFAMFLSKPVVGMIRSKTQAGPRNPAAARELAPWAISSGIFALLCFGILAWLRMANSESLGTQVGLCIVVVELSLFVLGGIFECLASIYDWSARLTAEFEQLQREYDDVRTQLGVITVDLAELDYQLGKMPEEDVGPEVSEEAHR